MEKAGCKAGFFWPKTNKCIYISNFHFCYLFSNFLEYSLENMEIHDMIGSMKNPDTQKNISILKSLFPDWRQATNTPTQVGSLPIWMSDSIHLIAFLGPDSTEPLFFVLYPEEHLNFDQIKRIHTAVSTKLDSLVIVSTDNLPAKHRPLLAKFHIPYIYKDKIVLAPELGIKFRAQKNSSSMPKEHEAHDTLSAFDLKLVAGFLLGHIPANFTLKILHEKILNKAISLPKLSRSLNSLASHGILTTQGEGPWKSFLQTDKRQIWQSVLSTKLSIFMREVSSDRLPKYQAPHVLAGESALALYSNLASPKQQTVAMHAKAYRSLYLNQDSRTLEQLADTHQPLKVQVWKEDPRLFSTDNRLNPVELFFSLHDKQDERIQLSLDEMLRSYDLK